MCILVGAGFVDGHRDAREEEEVKALLHRLRIFKEMGAGKMDELHERVVRRLHPNAATPLDTKLVLSTCESACKKLKSEKLGESVFVNAVDIAFADTEIEPEEVSYLNMLVEKLELPVERANALINFIKIKNHNMG
jgi:tellurite resistance protein